MDEETRTNQILDEARQDIKDFSLEDLRTMIRDISQKLIDSQYDDTTKGFHIGLLMLTVAVNEYQDRLKGQTNG